MNKKLERVFDFLLGTNKKVLLKKVYYRPQKGKAIFGFAFSLLFMFILLFVMGFRWNLLYLLLFLVDFSVLYYYGVNLFTKRGFLLPKYVEVSDDNKYVRKEEE